MTIADLIRTRLEEMGARQRDLRAELDRIGVRVSRQTISAWCSGRDRPRDEHMFALFQVLAIPVQDRSDWFEARLRREPESAA